MVGRGKEKEEHVERKNLREREREREEVGRSTKIEWLKKVAISTAVF